MHFACREFAGAAQPIRATVSIGLAILDGHADWDSLLDAADQALYRAKRGGRNRTVLAGD